MTDEEIAEDIPKGDTIEEEEEDGGKESVVRIPKLSEARGALDSIITYIDLTADEESNQLYPHFRALRDMIIRKQHNRRKQLKIHSFSSQLQHGRILVNHQPASSHLTLL